MWVCSSAGRAAISKVAGRGFESLRTRIAPKMRKGGGYVDNRWREKEGLFFERGAK